MFPRPRSIIKFPDSVRNRNPEEYKGTVFYRTFVLLAPFYNSGTRCIWINWKPMFDGYRQSHFLRVQNPRFLCKSDEGLANRVLGRPGLTPQAKKSGYSMDWKPSYVCWILLVCIYIWYQPELWEPYMDWSYCRLFGEYRPVLRGHAFLYDINMSHRWMLEIEEWGNRITVRWMEGADTCYGYPYSYERGASLSYNQSFPTFFDRTSLVI